MFSDKWIAYQITKLILIVALITIALYEAVKYIWSLL